VRLDDIKLSIFSARIDLGTSERASQTCGDGSGLPRKRSRCRLELEPTAI